MTAEPTYDWSLLSGVADPAMDAVPAPPAEAMAAERDENDARSWAPYSIRPTPYRDDDGRMVTDWPEPGPLSEDERQPLEARLVGEPTDWQEPEDRGSATLSDLGDVEYVADLIRPGRIVVWAAEEGCGKSYAVDDELGIRLAVAGGSFAGTWPIVTTGPVLYLSEMHADDDWQREETTLASLGLDRTALAGCYYRLPLMTAAGGKPALTVPEWRAWATGWLKKRGARLLIFDTATGATRVDPWGGAIQAVYEGLRMMLAEYPELAVVLVLHMRKPNGRGERRISDVLGEWGRWCDVVVLMENDGASLERVRLTVRKRVRHERRIVATKRGGLLVDPVDVATAVAAPKVAPDAVVEAAERSPGMTLAELAKALGVTKPTASKYVREQSDRLRLVGGSGKSPAERAYRVYPVAKPQSDAKQAPFATPLAVGAAEGVEASQRGRSRIDEYATPFAIAPPAAAADVDLTTEALRIFGDDVVPS